MRIIKEIINMQINKEEKRKNNNFENKFFLIIPFYSNLYKITQITLK